jgi:hypothetical protein
MGRMVLSAAGLMGSARACFFLRSLQNSPGSGVDSRLSYGVQSIVGGAAWPTGVLSDGE